MEHLNQADATSHDIVADNIDKLKAIFPEAITEGKIDFDVLKETLGEYRETREERYNFSWAGKSKARRLAQAPTTGTLRPSPEDSLSWENTRNLLIEGDNLEVLKLLQKSYQGKVNVIYIDPPYNTGSDFVYPDKYADNLKGYLEYTNQVDAEGNKQSSNTESSGRYHSSWLNMMMPRLHLAKNLLSNDGVIFVSIGDEESASLKLLLSEVFGEENFIETIVVEISTTSGPKTVNAQQGTIVKNAEFVHIFRKSADFDKTPHTPLLDGVQSYDTHYTSWLHEDGTLGSLTDIMMTDEEVASDIAKFGFVERGKFSINNMDKLLQVSEHAKSFIESNLDKIASIDRPPVSASECTPEVGKWMSFNPGHRTYYLTTQANGKLRALMPLSLNYRMSDDYKPRFGRTVIRGDLWKGFHHDMGNVAKEGDVQFPNGKKPLRLIHQLLKWSSKAGDGLVLDFFSGSGTTAHAVMELNRRDGGNRRSIMVQLPEKLDPSVPEQKNAYDFCKSINKPGNISELTKERIRRATKKINEEHPEYNGDIGFKVFKLDSSNIEAWDSNVENLEDSVLKAANVLKDDRSELDIVYELFLKYGLDLSYPVNTHEVAGKKVYEIGAGSLFICLEDGITTDFVEALIKLYNSFDDEAAPRVVFKDSGFKTDAAKKDAESTLKDAGILDVKCL